MNKSLENYGKHQAAIDDKASVENLRRERMERKESLRVKDKVEENEKPKVAQKTSRKASQNPTKQNMVEDNFPIHISPRSNQKRHVSVRQAILKFEKTKKDVEDEELLRLAEMAIEKGDVVAACRALELSENDLLGLDILENYAKRGYRFWQITKWTTELQGYRPKGDCLKFHEHMNEWRKKRASLPRSQSKYEQYFSYKPVM